MLSDFIFERYTQRIYILKRHTRLIRHGQMIKRGVPSAESSRSVRGLGKGVSGKPYPRLCNVRRPRLEPRTFRSQAVRLYRLHQARPSPIWMCICKISLTQRFGDSAFRLTPNLFYYWNHIDVHCQCLVFVLIIVMIHHAG